MAQADNSDMVFLGDLKPKKIDNRVYSIEEQGHLAIAFEILSSNLLFPPLRPTLGNFDWAQVKKSEQIFWKEYLRGVLPNETLEATAALIAPLLIAKPVETAWVLADLLFKSVQSNQHLAWENIALHRQAIMRSMDPYQVTREYENKLKDNLPDGDLQEVERQLQASPTFFEIRDILKGNKRGQSEDLTQFFRFVPSRRAIAVRVAISLIGLDIRSHQHRWKYIQRTPGHF